MPSTITSRANWLYSWNLWRTWLADLDLAFQEVSQHASNVPQAILQMAATAGQCLRSADRQLPIILEFWRQANRDPSVWQAAIAPYRRYQDYFSDIIHRALGYSPRPLYESLADAVDWFNENRQYLSVYL